MNRIIFLFLLTLLSAAPLQAEVIELYSKETIEAEIVSRDDHSLTVVSEKNKPPVKYWSDQIAAINGKPFYPLDSKLARWIKSNTSPQTDLFKSFFIPEEEKKDAYKRMGKSDSLTGIIERMIVEEGMSVYDAALGQIIMTLLGDEQSLEQAFVPIKYYWKGRFGVVNSLRAGYMSQPYVYDPSQPDVIGSDIAHKGLRGFVFRIINVHGHYQVSDPLDGKMVFEGFPNSSLIHWEDWKPIAGENAWVVMGALHLYHKKHFNPMKRGYKHNFEEEEVLLAQEMARAALYLQADNGGIRMAPMGTHYTNLGVQKGADLEAVARFFDEQAREAKTLTPRQIEEGPLAYPDEFKWYYYEISTENNLSWYAAFRMLYAVTRGDRYHQAMKDIERYLKSIWNTKKNYFEQGMHYHPDEQKWHPNTEHFASDVQNWALVVLGPKTIDDWFGQGAAFKLWRTTKSYSGFKDGSGRLLGVGYTRENDRMSIEWTAGAIFAARFLAAYYRESHPDWADEALRDSVDMRRGMERFRGDFSGSGAAYAYSSKRGWIPFGWFSHDENIYSLASTCWVMLVDAHFNPFILLQN